MGKPDIIIVGLHRNLPDQFKSLPTSGGHHNFVYSLATVRTIDISCSLVLRVSWYNQDMSTKKPSKPRRVVKRRGKGLRNLGGPKRDDKNLAKGLPDTSRIPWFPPMPKTGTDA